MNLAGKILTFLIFFLSVAFLVLAVMVGNTHQAWKTVAIENKAKVSEARTIVQELRGKSGEIQKTLNAERVARRLQLAQLESQLSEFQKAVDVKEKELTDRLVISQRAQQALVNAEKRLNELDTQISELRSKNKTYVDDIAAQSQSVVNLTNQIVSLKGQSKELEILNMDLASEVALRRKVMKLNGLSPTALTDQIPPEVDGVVYRTKNNLIAISLGSDDGINVGHEFDIYRGDRFIGKARVTRTKENISAAELISEFQQAPVAEGDHVSF